MCKNRGLVAGDASGRVHFLDLVERSHEGKATIEAALLNLDTLAIKRQQPKLCVDCWPSESPPSAWPVVDQLEADDLSVEPFGFELRCWPDGADPSTGIFLYLASPPRSRDSARRGDPGCDGSSRN